MLPGKVIVDYTCMMKLKAFCKKTPDVTLLTKLSDFFSKGVEKNIFTIKVI